MSSPVVNIGFIIAYMDYVQYALLFHPTNLLPNVSLLLTVTIANQALFNNRFTSFATAASVSVALSGLAHEILPQQL